MSHFRPLSKAPIEVGVKDSPLWSRWFAELINLVHYIRTYEAAVTPASVAANSESTQTFTVTGLQASDVVTLNAPSKTAGLSILDYYISAANTLSVTYRNFTGGAIVPTAETYRISTIRL